MATALTVDEIVAWLKSYRADIGQNAAYLTELDSPIGDADHGANMDRGMGAVIAGIDDESVPTVSISGLTKAVGMKLISTVGGSAGPLYGTFFLRFGLGVDSDWLSPEQFAEGLRRGLDGIVSRGKAELGDKTMVDALSPAVDALDAALAAGTAWPEAIGAAADAAEAGRDATTPMLARKGRASYLGERSIGHQDPGATSIAMLIRDAASTITGENA